MEQNQILGYLGALFQKNAPITDEVFSALKECLTPTNINTGREVPGETKRIRAAINSLGFRHGKNLDAYVEYEKPENEGKAPVVFLTIESKDGYWTSRHSKLTFKVYESGYADTILECSSRNGEDWHAYEIPTMLGVGAAYYALLAWEAYQGIEAGRLDAVEPEDALFSLSKVFALPCNAFNVDAVMRVILQWGIKKTIHRKEQKCSRQHESST